MNKLFVCLALSALLIAPAAAKSKRSVRSMTGCLSKGDSATEFLLTAKNGSTWEMHSNSAVDLASHVGHEVKITGAVSHAKLHNLKEDAKDTAKDTGVKKKNTEHGHLEPTKIDMVSDTCTK